MRARLVLLTAVAAAAAATTPPAHAAVPICETVTTSNPPHVVTVCVKVNPAMVVLTPVTVIIPAVCVASVCVGPIPMTFPMASACADTPDVTIEVDGQPVTFPPLTICV